MANLLIGSLNLYRHYKVADFPNIRQYRMLKSSQMTGFSACIGGLVKLAYVAGFTSRPMMHIRMTGPPTGNTRPIRSFTFIDSVSRYGRQLSKEELETAYRKAGFGPSMVNSNKTLWYSMNMTKISFNRRSKE
jgi:hypothetical protein